MSEVNSPAVARHRLLRALRQLRENAALSQQQVAARFEWSLSKVIRMENGSVGISVPDMLALATVYKIEDDHLKQLFTLARIAKKSRWWHQYRSIIPAQLQEFIGYEADALSIRVFHPNVLPALLQIRGYAKALANPLMLEPVDEKMAEQLIDVRMRRYKEVLDHDDRPDYTAIIDEAVLHRVIGGVDVMSMQLRRLIYLTRRGIISLGIVPFSAGSYFGLTGAFHILHFDEGDSNAVLYLENAQSSVTMQKTDLVKRYRDHFEAMYDGAVTGNEAVSFLEHVAASKYP